MKDAYNLQRYLDAQERMYDTALAEIKAGRKQSHWIWYIFPQLKGLGHSYNSSYYGINGIEEAKAYFEHPILQERLIEITYALLEHAGATAEEILGFIDARKVHSRATLFLVATEEDIFQRVIATFYGNKPDRRTIYLINSKDISKS